MNGWLLRLNNTGGIVWQKSYVGPGTDMILEMKLTPGGNIVAVGRTNAHGAGLDDIWVLMMDGDGNVLWQRAIGTWSVDFAFSVQPTYDGGAVAAGFTKDGAVLVKLGENGEHVWTRVYGAIADEIHSVSQTRDGGFVIGGGILFPLNDRGRYTAFVARLDPNGLVPGCRLEGSSTSTITDAAGITSLTMTTTSEVVDSFATAAVTNAESTTRHANGRVLCPGR